MLNIEECTYMMVVISLNRVMLLLLLVVCVNTSHALFPGASPEEGDYRHLYPVVAINLHLQDHAHVLPYSLGTIEQLDYPKDRVSINLFIDASVDATLDKAKWWIKNVDALYRSTYMEKQSDNWLERALQRSRLTSARYALFLKGDHVLLDKRIVQHLMALNKLLVSPLLDAPFDGNASIFISDQFNSRQSIATVQMDRVTEPMLLDLSHTDASYVTFSRDNLPASDSLLPTEPLSVFAHSANRMNIPLFLDNHFFYGYILHSTQYSLNYRRQLIRYLVSDMVSDDGLMPIVHSTSIRPSYPKPSLFNMDHIYVINLQRRYQRRAKMSQVLKLMGFDYQLWRATDGTDLVNEPFADEVVMLPTYEDPFHKRPIKDGEIGCFLSHYRIWRDVVDKSLERVIVFEDDLRFVVNSTVILSELIEDLDQSAIPWDLVYLGRKRLENVDESWVPGHRHLSTVGYSYWTLGYMLSLSGAQKLINAEPLSKLLPVDEYIPIMFNQHPNVSWKEAFSNRDLIAYSVFPTVVVPERYTYDKGYVSDTEDSFIHNAHLIRDEL